MKYRVNSPLRTAIILADLVLLVAVLLAATAITMSSPGNSSPSAASILVDEWGLVVSICAVWLSVTLGLGTYRAVQNRLAYQELGHVLKAGVVSGVALSGLLFLTSEGGSRLRLVCFLALALPLLMLFRLALRVLYRLFYRRAWGTAMLAPARVVVVGEGTILYDTLCTLSNCDPHEVALLGYIDYQEDLAHAVDESPAGNGFQAATDTLITDPLATPNGNGAHAPAEQLVLAHGRSAGDGRASVEVVSPIFTSASARAAARWGLADGAEPGGDKPKAVSQQDAAKPLGTVIERLVMSTAADNVVVAISRRYHSLLSGVVSELQRLPVHIVLMPDVADLTIVNLGVTELGEGHPALKLRAPILTDLQLAIKRCLDLAIVIPLLPILVPLMGCIALAIRLDSRGPILFRQRRVGQYGKQFTIYKFRTMVEDAEARVTEVTTYTEEGKPIFKSDGRDPRVTRVGRVLRRLSLDELPQLFNVLRGHMSLVGPRPELPRYVGFYDTWQHFRLWVPPGITGWWQIKGREKQPMYLNWDDDLYYIRNYSILLDLQILWLTLSHALLGSTGR